jgi:hypothetical protein
LLRLGGIEIVADKNSPINAVIRTLLLLDWARIDQAERSPLN